MFKRRRATSTPAPNRPPSASASLAASKAFLQNRESNASLSSAAAAAALRTHPSGPTAVADMVTKRMVRKASISSQGSGSQQRPVLGRSPSSGSMTERSFRSPSPSRNSPVIGPLDDAPPVPAVPKDIPGLAAVHRRASSLEPPQRATSTRGRGRGRGQSMDSTGRTQPGVRQNVMSLAQVPEDDYSGRPRSVNFSRPMSPSASSITSQTTPTPGGHSGWFAAPVTNPSIHFRTGPPTRPRTAVGVRRYDAQNTWQAIQDAADKPVSTRRNQIPQGVEGARLATGSMRARPSGSSVSLTSSHQTSGPVDPKSADAVYDPSTRTFIRKQEAMARFRELHEEEEPPPAHLIPYAPVSRESSPAVYHKTQPSPVPFRDVRELDIRPPQHVPRVSSPAFSNADLQHSTRSFQAPARDPSPLPLEEVRGRYPTPPGESNGEVLDQVEAALRSSRPLAEDRADSEKPHPAETDETGAILARQTSEDLAGPDIRPSPDANISRKLDTTLSEPVKVPMESSLSPKLASDQDSLYPRMDTPDVKIGRGRGSIRTDRGSSLSPPRSAHFAVGSLELPNGIRHQPPPRSVSPVKSALKSSPSVSRRNSSPLANNGRVLSKGPLSETSDAVSEEGTSKKKKSVRVSFEETPIVAGISAYEDAPSSPSGLDRSRWSAFNHDEDLDDFMKPRPALPSFGSIREKNRRHIERDEPEKVTETVSSSMTTSVGSIHDPIEASSDHALGHIVADDFASKKQSTSRDPLPPEVTSVEGSGYYSDSGSSDTALEGVAPEHADGAGKESSIAEPKSLANGVDFIPPRVEVPVIAIQPATPNLIETAEPPTLPSAPAVTDTSHTESNIRHTAIPGWWDDEDGQAGDGTQERKQLVESAPSTRISFVEPPSPSRKQEPESSDDDDDSIYSDAYEELAETEGGAFASIDEIVESPIVTPRAGLMQSRYAPTETSPRIVPAAIVEGSVNTTTTATGGREKTEGRSQIGQAVTAPPTALPSSAMKPAPKQNGVAPQATAIGASPKATVSSRTVQPTPKPAQEPVPVQPRKSSLKKPTGSMQAAPVGDSQMRRTMRGPSSRAQPSSPEPSMRTYMRSSGSMAAGSALGLAASRHSMSAIDSTAPGGALQKKNVAAAAVQSKHRPQNVEVPVKHMPLAYDSDSGASESSFQRERKQRRASRAMDTGGRYTMRRSMRTEPAPTMRPTLAIRPMSPATTSSPPPPAFRKSLRHASPVQEAGPAKSSRFSIRSLSPAGRFRNTLSKGSKAKAPALSTSKPAVSSRFEDSSDEEFQSRSKRFQSRFADSDDEEDFVLPPGLAPVRGIPKRPGEEDADSTDLEDEESEDEAPPPAKPLDKSPGALSNGHSTGLQKSKHATLLPAFESPKKAKTKRGLFGLGKKKDLTPPSPESTTKPKNGLPKPTGASDIPMPPAHRDRDTNRTLTPIGEEENVFETPPSVSHRAPKLQRRITPQNSRSTSDSWPLPASPATTAVDERPRMSDGAGAEKQGVFKRPTLSKRWSSTTGTGTLVSTATSGVVVDPKTGKEIIVGRSGKKKKFQGLRRVFGLND